MTTSTSPTSSSEALTYHHRATCGPVELAFTDRLGGDLALGAGGAEAAWVAVLADFAPGPGPREVLADARQVHGRDVGTASRGGCVEGVDALVTGTPGVVLAVRSADCVPVLLADPASGLVGAAHAGRDGVAAGVVPATVARLRELGAGDLRAWLGPHVCGRCYEVPAALRDEVAAVVPATRAETSWGTPSLDLGAGVTAQLTAAGVLVEDVSACTVESPDLWSYRRDGVHAGRQAALIRVRP